MLAPEPPISQTQQTRCAVEGRLVNGGGACTLVLIREGVDWLFYPHGVTGLAVHLTGPSATKVARTILGEDRTAPCWGHSGPSRLAS